MALALVANMCLGPLRGWHAQSVDCSIKRPETKLFSRGGRAEIEIEIQIKIQNKIQLKIQIQIQVQIQN